MGQIKVILTDDFGKEVGYHEYMVGEGINNLSRIERRVEQLRPQILSDITQDLLTQEQGEYKKTHYRSKGSYPIKIKTINGSFEFEVTRYCTEEGRSNWLRLSERKGNSHQESELLEEFAIKWATRLSYQRVSELVLERSGTSSLSDQRIYEMVQGRVEELVSEHEGNNQWESGQRD